MTDYKYIEGVNFSTLKHILQSPAHYQAALTSEREETIDMRLGTMVHGWFLEDRVPSYIVRPEEIGGKPWHGNRIECKAWKAEQEAAGVIVMSPDDSLREIRMCESLNGSEVARQVLAYCPNRESVVTAQFMGVNIKAKLDAWGRDDTGRLVIVDLKKTIDGSPAGFGKKALGLDYDMQAEIYKAALSLSLAEECEPLFVWLTVEDSDASPVTAYPQPIEAIATGRAKLEKAITLLKGCRESNLWPAYASGSFGRLEWPRWAAVN